MRNKSNQLVFWILLIVFSPAPAIVFGQSSCGEKIPALGIYDQISQYSIWAALLIAITGILLDQKSWKRILLLLAVFPLAAWGYVHFMVDYTSLKNEIFTYNAMAESTLANIAEAQDRYKSEQGTILVI